MIKKPIWLEMAMLELGVKEVPGDGDNPTIAQYWRDAELYDTSMGQDEVPWCAAFANAMLMRAGADGTKAANARSFLKYGVPLKMTPVLGAISVFSRPGSEWQGHVNFYLGHDAAGNVVGVGGNQGNAVSVAPFKAMSLLGFFWPKGFKVEPEWIGRRSYGAQLKEVSDR